ncbi:MAG: hypothetical protein ACLUO4_07945 [Christensenellales bacterium]
MVDGRDVGTAMLPGADVSFPDGKPEERANAAEKSRRQRALLNRLKRCWPAYSGIMTIRTGPLRRCARPDAVVIDSTNCTPEQVLRRMTSCGGKIEMTPLCVAWPVYG